MLLLLQGGDTLSLRHSAGGPSHGMQPHLGWPRWARAAATAARCVKQARRRAPVQMALGCVKTSCARPHGVRTTSRVVTPSTRFSSYTPSFFRVCTGHERTDRPTNARINQSIRESRMARRVAWQAAHAAAAAGDAAAARRSAAPHSATTRRHRSLRTSTAMGTVELTGLEMMFSRA